VGVCCVAQPNDAIRSAPERSTFSPKGKRVPQGFPFVELESQIQDLLWRIDATPKTLAEENAQQALDAAEC
jgi:hypothetical protein